MFHIKGQPINFNYLATSKIVREESSDKAKHILRICEFGLKHGYKAAIDGFNISKSTYYHYLKHYKLCKEYKFKRVHARFGNKMTPFERHRQLVNDGKIIC